GSPAGVPRRSSTTTSRRREAGTPFRPAWCTRAVTGAGADPGPLRRRRASSYTFPDSQSSASSAATKTPRTPTQRSEGMSLVRLLPGWFDAIDDYAVAGTLIVVAALVGGSTEAVAAGLVIGVVGLVVRMLTKYPLGVVKVLPFTIHSAGDYLAAALLVSSPFVLGFDGSDGGLTAFYIAAGAAVLAVSLITNYQYNPKRQWAGEPATATDTIIEVDRVVAAATTPPRPDPARQGRPLRAPAH